VLLLLTQGSHIVKADGGKYSPNIDIEAKKEFTKTIKEEFDISANGKVGIANKYGEVNINTWDRNQVKVEVTITVNARNESRAQEVFDLIDIDFSNGRDYVNAETSIGSNKGWNWWGSSNKHDYTIDYEVYMPNTNNLKLSNKYGNSYIADIGGEAHITIKYGNVRMEKIENVLNLHLGYGNGTIIECEDVNVGVSYGKVRLKEANDVDVESKYSKVFIDKGQNIKTLTKYDTYEIGHIKNFRNQGKYDDIEILAAETVRASSKYSDFKVDELVHSADFDLQYGSAAIESLHKDFSEVQMIGRYTEYKVRVEGGANYKLDAVTKYAGLRYPDGMNVVYEKEKGSSHEVEGYMGEKGAGRVIKARLDYGGIKVRE